MTSYQAHNTPVDTSPIVSLIAAGQFAQARALADTVLATHPGHADVLYLKGLAARAQGDRATAIVAFNQAVRSKPDYKDACAELARTLEEAGQTALAVKTYEHLLKIELAGSAPRPAPPLTPQAQKAVRDWFAKGLEYMHAGDPENGAAAFRKVIAIQPEAPEALANLGLMLWRMSRAKEAEEVLLRCLRLKPDYAPAFNLLGNSYKVIDGYTRALAAYRRAVAVDPHFHHGWINLGKTYYEMHNFEEAIRAYEQTLVIAPTYLEAMCELLYMLHMVCRWDKVEPLKERMLATLHQSDQGAEPFIVAAFAPAWLQLENAKRWTKKLYPAGKPYEAATPLPATERADGKLRIGYLSADFHCHATAYLITEMFELHDRGRFEIYAYSYGKEIAAAEQARIKDAVDHFHYIKDMDDAAAVDLIRSHGVDVLVDLKGYTKGHRLSLMARRPAPVQMHYLGFPGTLGAPFIDYFIADHVTAPPGADSEFSEHLIRLPQCYQINDRARPLPSPLMPRTEYGLPDEGFVFCDFNNPYKITPALFSLWMRILKAVDDSVLWLYETDPETTLNLRRMAVKQQVDPSRLVTANATVQAEHLARYCYVDLFLDTSPVCGHTTASDALWCGVPVVTLKQESFVSRVAASLLTCVGLPELIAPDMESYEALAIALARDPKRLAGLKQHLEDGRLDFTVFDSAATTRALEAAYIHAASLHAQKRAPHAFSLSGDLTIAA